MTATDTSAHVDPTPDQRPTFAIGHVSLTAADVDTLHTFYHRLGFRSVARMSGLGILEMRGGTHLVVSHGPAGQGSLDLMVDDLEAVRRLFIELDTEPTDIVEGFPHSRFVVTDPEGNRLVVQSSHVAGPV